MTQIRNIFVKDLRRLWPLIALVFVLIILHAIFDVKSSPQGVQPESRFNLPDSILDLLLPLAIGFLIAFVVLQESLVGEKQFWITRPYDWRKLLSAKILFLIVMINLPLLISDCSILAAQYLPVRTVIPQLLLRQFHITLLFLVPAFAIAVISTNIAQFVMFAVVGVLTTLMSSLLFPLLISKGQAGAVVTNTFGFEAIVAFLPVIVLYQYATRGTSKARVAFGSVLLFSTPLAFYFPFWPTPKTLNQRNDPVSTAIRIDYDLSNISRVFIGHESPLVPVQTVKVQIPLKVTGLPPGTLLRGAGRSEFLTPARSKRLNGLNQFAAAIEFLDDRYVLEQALDRSSINLLKNKPTEVETSLDLELVNDQPNVSLNLTAYEFSVPGVGRCRVFQNQDMTQIACRAGLQPQVETSLRILSKSGLSLIGGTFASSGVPWGLSPVTQAGQTPVLELAPGSLLQFIPRTALANFHRTLRLPDFAPENFIGHVDDQQDK